MRKLMWCCLATGTVAAGSLLSACYYACSYPDSLVGRVLFTASQASVAFQPFTGLSSLAARVNQSSSCVGQGATAGSTEECVPDEPQPMPVEVKEAIEQAIQPAVANERTLDVAPNADPIVIHEEDPIPAVEPAPIAPSTIDMDGLKGQEVPGNVCPISMPYCQDDDETPAMPPKMPYAGDGKHEAKDEPKPANALKESADNAFSAWMKLWTTAPQTKPENAEELPPPTEEPSEPKCQEDPNRHEQYSGCPHTTCPYTGKSYPLARTRPSGKEESSEEPATKGKEHPTRKPTSKGCHDEKQCPTQGVDTMEYRKSDGGLNEYGPGPYH